MGTAPFVWTRNPDVILPEVLYLLIRGPVMRSVVVVMRSISDAEHTNLRQEEGSPGRFRRQPVGFPESIPGPAFLGFLRAELPPFLR